MILFILVTVINCNVNRNVDFCKILETDQSNLYSPEVSDEENKLAHSRRKQIFLQNFDILLLGFEKDKIPKIDEKNYLNDTCQHSAILATFIHISQTRPDLFYTEANIKLFKDQIESKRLDSEILYTAIKIGSHNKTCDKLSVQIEKAIRIWGLDERLYKGFKFIKC
jgi:hypothetical protein